MGLGMYPGREGDPRWSGTCRRGKELPLLVRRDTTPHPTPIPQAAELLLRGRDAVLAEGCTVHLVVPTPQSGIPSRVT